MFPTNIKLFVAFQGEDSMKMVSQPQNEEAKSWNQFFYEAIQPYQDMIDNPIYPRRLRNKLKGEIGYTKLLITFFKLELQHGKDHEKYRLRIAEQLKQIEQLVQELDKFIQ